MKETCDAKQKDMQDNENTFSHFVLDLVLRFLLFIHSDANIHNDIIDVIVQNMRYVIHCSNGCTLVVDIFEEFNLNAKQHETFKHTQKVILYSNAPSKIKTLENKNQMKI